MRQRDLEEERRERLRYKFLERFYLITGAECGAAVSSWQVQEELGFSMAGASPITDDLVRLGYLAWGTSDSEICITAKGIDFLRNDAWRRRSIRD